MATFDYYDFGVLRNDGNWSAFCLYNDAIRPDRFLTQVETVTSKNDVIQLIETRATSVKARLEAKGFQNVILGTIQSSSNNYVYKSITYDAFPTSGDDSGGDGGDITIPDYTQILTSINTNLTALNTNIVNKNNQSDIVSCLNNIFCYEKNNTYFSSIKDSALNSSEWDNTLKSNNVINLLFNILSSLSNVTIAKNSISIPVSNRVLDNISKKISNIDVSNINNASLSQSDLCSRIYYLIQALVSSISNTSNTIISNSLLKQISEKLANSNDLHTISQAIDLISTAIAQAPTTDTTGLQTELGKISTAVNNIENNPLFELNANVNGIEVCKKNNKNELDF